MKRNIAHVAYNFIKIHRTLRTSIGCWRHESVLWCRGFGCPLGVLWGV